MGRADPDRSGHPAAATAGTLDSGEQAAEATGQTQGQGEDAAGQAGARPSRIRAAAPQPRQAVTGSARMGRALRSPLARHAGILLCFIAAGVLVTIPLAANLAGRIPAARDPASYVWDFWWVAHQVTHLGNPWFTPLMAAPVGVQLGFHTVMPLPGVLFTPVTLAFGPALLLQPVDRAPARAALLCDVPGGPAVAALGHRRGRRPRCSSACPACSPSRTGTT